MFPNWHIVKITGGLGLNKSGLEPTVYDKSGKLDHFEDDPRCFGRSNGDGHCPGDPCSRQGQLR